MKNTLTKSMLVLAVGIVIFGVAAAGCVLNLKLGIEDSILRLHIVGASNSASDQELKLCVRDRVLTDFSGIFNDCKTLGEAKAAVSEHESEIERAATDELRSRGCYSTVRVELGECRFPTKIYGSIALPGGNYTALNIKIGNAEGENWWCVMYPPLCITDNTVIMSEDSEKKLRASLTPEEYRLVTESGEPTIKIKFKIAEILGSYIR